MECAICHLDKPERDMVRCPLCHQHACEDCRFSRQGRHFCSRYCGESFFYSDEDGEDED
ncbi:MAG: hypothetical protein O7F16_08860 [Acidobacteria bacterium]|nr:hypothetical protein [Acidobacteriota bacterium]